MEGGVLTYVLHTSWENGKHRRRYSVSAGPCMRGHSLLHGRQGMGRLPRPPGYRRQSSCRSGPAAPLPRQVYSLAARVGPPDTDEGGAEGGAGYSPILCALLTVCGAGWAQVEVDLGASFIHGGRRDLVLPLPLVAVTTVAVTAFAVTKWLQRPRITRISCRRDRFALISCPWPRPRVAVTTHRRDLVFAGTACCRDQVSP